MKPRRIGTIAIPVGCALAVAFAAQPLARAQQSKSTWGQILIANARLDGPVALYDPASNRFAPETSSPPMKGRVRATGTILVSGPNAGKVLLAGGVNRNNVARASTELYDPATNTVVPGPAMTTPRSGYTATALAAGPNAGKILFAGGMDDLNDKLSSTELYDPATNKFSPGPPMRTGCELCTATVIPSGKNAGKVLLVGFYNPHGVPGATELYDPAVNAFGPGPIMHSLCTAVSATLIPSGKNAGRILFAGCARLNAEGNLAGAGIDDATELYDPATDKFLLGPTMKPAREAHTATAIVSGPNFGKILIAGGEFDDHPWEEIGREASLTSTEFYDPDTNTFAPGPQMNSRRVAHTATVIRSGKNAGKILIAGGINKDTDKNGRGVFRILDTTELYDPATNTFAPGPEMNAPRFDNVALQLPPAP